MRQLSMFIGAISVALLLLVPSSQGRFFLNGTTDEAKNDFEAKITQGLLDFYRQNIAKTAKGVHKGLKEYLPQEIDTVIPYLRDRFNGNYRVLPKDLHGITCTACTGAIEGLLLLFDAGVSYNAFKDAAIGLCNVILDETVCRGALDNYFPEIWYILNEKGDAVTGGRFCAVVLGGQCGAWEDVNSWTIDVPGGKPEVIEPTLPEEGSTTTRILHLTDVHLDLSYTVGTSSKCGLPLCCMNTTEMATDPDEAAGYWGNYYCDTPIWMFKDMLLHIKEKHIADIDYILLTGDYPAHDVWLQSREANLEHIESSVKLVKEIFPDKQVIPVMGNHDTFPCNSFPPADLPSDEFKPDWLYTRLRDIYSGWVPESAMETLGKYGYYTFELKPGFRIIAMNNMNCYSMNFWLNYNWVDPMNNLAWLVEQLSAAEAAGELVHIVNHIPPGNPDCLGAWGREYAKIVDRYENIIRAQFYGHTHNDEFIVFYDVETNSRATNIGFLTPSVTTYKGLNPSYRIYTIDGFEEGSSLRVLDHETYIMNLETANELGESVRPSYFKYYSAKKDLEMESLFPKNYDALARRMATDDTFYDKYFRYYNSDSWGDYDHDRRNVVCGMISTSIIDERKCDELMGPK